MNLVAFSIRTKGAHNFARRLGTVFTRFGFTEIPTRRALYTIVDALHRYNSAPTFFIPAVVLGRHSSLIAGIARDGAEIGIHGYVHNDYRTLNKDQQFRQTKQAMAVFQEVNIPFYGFRNPYLGWTEESLQVFTALGFSYESNEAIEHDVIDLDRLSPLLRSGYEKSLVLFQAIPCNAYALRPHFEGKLLRIPTSIPDDEMLFDRLRLNAEQVGNVWSKVMQRVYDFGGIYTLNLHPERGILCKRALDVLLAYTGSLTPPVWIAPLQDVAQWWKERSQFKLKISSDTPDRWRVEASCTLRATLLARYLTVEDQPTTPWFGPDVLVKSHCCIVNAAKCPCIALSADTPRQVADFLQEQGYPTLYCSQEDADIYSLYLDLPAGFGASREEEFQQRSELVQQIEALEAPLLHFGCWPGGCRAALAISSDIDSVTVQDFFLRVLEV
jgi:peptidoglycan/xylan/chitin deacetylase (PgdA/CDA1 family)